MRVADVILIFAVGLFLLHEVPISFAAKFHLSTDNSFGASLFFWQIGALVGLLSKGTGLRKALYAFAFLLLPAITLFGLLTATLA